MLDSSDPGLNAGRPTGDYCQCCVMLCDLTVIVPLSARTILKPEFLDPGPNHQLGQNKLGLIGLIYTRDGSSVWDELGQRTVVRLIIRLCINTVKPTDHPSR